MRVIHRQYFNVSRSDEWRIVPLGDIHLGARACDETRLKRVVDRIAKDDRALWIGMGDYCDFINVRDPRFSSDSLAKWITVADLTDLARVQRDKFLECVRPIAPKCLALMEGNHETAITKYYERAIFSEIVTGVKAAGGFKADDQLGIGYYGWLQLHFYRSRNRDRAATITLNLHHGFVGGKLAGAKALDMQRWLWTHDADVVLFGHSHNTGMQGEAVESVDTGGNVILRNRFGGYTGTFLRPNDLDSSTYSERKGFFPAPMAGLEVHLHPHAYEEAERVRVIAVN